MPLADDPGVRMMALVAASQRQAALALTGEEPDRSVYRLPMYHHLRGTLLEEAGRLEDARLAYERALVLDPAQDETTVNLGPVLARLGRAGEARRRLDELLEREPGAEGALRNRAVVRLAQGDLDGAIEDLEAAQAVLPRSANATALAELYAKKGDAEVSEYWKETARRLDPRAGE